jgi:anti-sigma factor RsiW
MIVQPEVRCVEFVDELTEWMEGALSADDRSLIEEHLSICPHCTRYLDQMRAALGVLRVAEPAATRAVVRDPVLTALRERRG